MAVVAQRQVTECQAGIAHRDQAGCGFRLWICNTITSVNRRDGDCCQNEHAGPVRPAPKREFRSRVEFRRPGVPLAARRCVLALMLHTSDGWKPEWNLGYDHGKPEMPTARGADMTDEITTDVGIIGAG